MQKLKHLGLLLFTSVLVTAQSSKITSLEIFAIPLKTHTLYGYDSQNVINYGDSLKVSRALLNCIIENVDSIGTTTDFKLSGDFRNINIRVVFIMKYPNQKKVVFGYGSSNYVTINDRVYLVDDAYLIQLSSCLPKRFRK